MVCLDTVGKKLLTKKLLLCEVVKDWGTEERTWWRGEAKEVGETRWPEGDLQIYPVQSDSVILLKYLGFDSIMVYKMNI